MAQRHATILEQQVSGSTAVLTLQVDNALQDFIGHFPGFPLLPGVTQINWAIRYAQQLLGAHARFSGMEVIKFQEPILPDAIVTLTLRWDNDKQKLHFEYQSGELSHSSGRIKLAA